MKALGKYLLGGDLHASLVVLALALLSLSLSIIGYVAVIIVGFVTLQKGLKSGLQILAFMILPAIAMAIVSYHDSIYLLPYLALLAQSFLIFFLAYAFHRGMRWSTLITAGTILGVVIIGIVHLCVPDVQAMWQHLLSKYIAGNTNILSALHWTSQQAGEVVQRVSKIMTGGIVFSFVFMSIVLLFIARWWQTRMFSPGLFRQEFLNIHMRWPIAVIGLAITALIFTQRPFVVDVVPVVLLPFILAGLSFVHDGVRIYPNLFLLLIFLYFFLLTFAFSFFVMLLLAVIGFVDAFVNLRKRLPPWQHKMMGK